MPEDQQSQRTALELVNEDGHLVNKVLTKYHSKLLWSMSTGSIVSFSGLTVPFPGLKSLRNMLSISSVYSSISSSSSLS